MINVDIVGCDKTADLYVLGYRGLEKLQVLAVCDTNLARECQRSKEWGIERIYSISKSSSTIDVSIWSSC